MKTLLLAAVATAALGYLVGAPAGYAAETTLYNFTGTDGDQPYTGLIADSSGNLFGTTSAGGTGNDGTVFELKNNGGGSYTQTTLHNFTGHGTDGSSAYGGVIADASGNLFGTTQNGGASGFGTVFELQNNGGGSYTPTTLFSFNGTDGGLPQAGLLADSAGNLFGTTYEGGTSSNCGTRGCGTAFELKNNGGGSYTQTTLYNFTGSGTDGVYPEAGLSADAAGNLFGTTFDGGAGHGTVFELKNNGGGSYTQTTLYDVPPSGAQNPRAGLLVDAAGNLFGTGIYGGTTDNGAVFELKNNGNGSYTPATLFSLNGPNGAEPSAGLIADAAGNLFGTAANGGAYSEGTVFELKNNGDGTYTPATLFSFNGTDGSGPAGGLLADAAGNLYGTTAGGGTGNAGNVFEITASEFVTSTPEPGSLTLLATGLAGLLLGRRRKRTR